jgi:hypothetical protein
VHYDTDCGPTNIIEYRGLFIVYLTTLSVDQAISRFE